MKKLKQKAREIRNDFDDWRANLEETTITADQQRAINHVKSTVNNDIQESMNQLEEYRVKLEKEKIHFNHKTMLSVWLKSLKID